MRRTLRIVIALAMVGVVIYFAREAVLDLDAIFETWKGRKALPSRLTPVVAQYAWTAFLRFVVQFVTTLTSGGLLLYLLRDRKESDGVEGRK